MRLRCPGHARRAEVAGLRGQLADARAEAARWQSHAIAGQRQTADVEAQLRFQQTDRARMDDALRTFVYAARAAGVGV